MNYEYGEAFVEITFPTRDVTTLMVRPSDILKVRELNRKNGKDVILIEITIRNGDGGTEIYYYDGELEDFKKNCKRVYL